MTKAETDTIRGEYKLLSPRRCQLSHFWRHFCDCYDFGHYKPIIASDR